VPSPHSDHEPAVGDRVGTPRWGRLTLATLAAVGGVLLMLFAISNVTIAADGTLSEPFWALALGTLVLTAAGVLGLTLTFRAVRRSSTCGRGGC
jgi:membrane protein implicated in regulation of membrane protease activity